MQPSEMNTLAWRSNPKSNGLNYFAGNKGKGGPVLQRRNYLFLLLNVRNELLARAEMLLHQPRRRMRQPLGGRDVLVRIVRKLLQKNQIFRARVLHVVRTRLLHIPHIALLEVEGPRLAAGLEDGHAALAAHVVLPLIG